MFGSEQKASIIYESELLAGVVAFVLWCKTGFGHLHTWFGDNDSVRYSLICASGTGDVARALLVFYINRETIQTAMVWFARVPTETNISHYPSRGQEHPLLTRELDQSPIASELLQKIVSERGKQIGDPQL